jgi:hypothetical protein
MLYPKDKDKAIAFEKALEYNTSNYRLSKEFYG